MPTIPVFLSPKAPLKTYARLTIDRPGAMLVAERTLLACWLEKQARDLRSIGATYTSTGRYTARVCRTSQGIEAK